MTQTRTKAEAEQAIRDTGFRVSYPRSWYNDELGFGYVFSIESDRNCYNHSMMEVRYAIKCLAGKADEGRPGPCFCDNCGPEGK